VLKLFIIFKELIPLKLYKSATSDGIAREKETAQLRQFFAFTCLFTTGYQAISIIM